YNVDTRRTTDSLRTCVTSAPNPRPPRTTTIPHPRSPAPANRRTQPRSRSPSSRRALSPRPTPAIAYLSPLRRRPRSSAPYTRERSPPIPRSAPRPESIPDILEVEQIVNTETGLELSADNVEKVLDEIRPYLSGTGGGSLELVQIDGYVVKIRISGPAAGVMTVRVAVTQKLGEKIPLILAVQLTE
ncbi:hypothetical protein U9M48_002085, partial [Paspalum notatum var. saurae]